MSDNEPPQPADDQQPSPDEGLWGEGGGNQLGRSHMWSTSSSTSGNNNNNNNNDDDDSNTAGSSPRFQSEDRAVPQGEELNLAVHDHQS